MWINFFLMFTFDVVICTDSDLLGSDESTYTTDHIKYMRNIKRRQICSQNESRCIKPSKRCWGYEKECSKNYMFQYPVCDKLPDRLMEIDRYTENFWLQGGFGYVKRKIDSMNILCESEEKQDGGSFKCSDKWEYCEAGNLYMDFRRVKLTDGERMKVDDPRLLFAHRYREDLHKGKNEIGGFCRVNKRLLLKPVNSPNNELRSWNAELKAFSALKSNPFKTNECDEIINKTTIFMKLDSGVNMYHHFCDFLNLYASQHIFGGFSTDVYIVNWDTSLDSYPDMFTETWDAFTQHPILRLERFVGKRICFKKAVFSLLPRMIYGLYYNTPLVDHCYGGGLLRAFSEHVLHRLGVHQNQYDDDIIRVTLLTRSTRYRNIINEKELVDTMRRIPGVNVSVVDYKYNNPSFIEQLKITHNSDIFIGIHGAGLTHLIFQPNWGAVFELYNTEDVHCYKDLARLRGLSYFTWENDELLKKEDKGITSQNKEGHPKFTNYAFDRLEFQRILTRAIKVVKIKRPSLREYKKKFSIRSSGVG